MGVSAMNKRPGNEYIGIHEVARLFGVNVVTIRTRVKKGRLPAPEIHVPYKTALWRRDRILAALAERFP